MEERWRGLASSDAGVRERTAEDLYVSPDKVAILGDAETVRALIEGVEKGSRTAASILLLGYVTGSTGLLQRLMKDHGEDAVKLMSWSRTVPLRIAALVSLSRAGDGGARRTLLQQAPDYPDNVRVFLLDVLRDIDAPEVLHVLSAYLKDETEIREGVPSGAERRRVADHAVDAFIDTLALPVKFERNPGGRYSVQQIEETHRILRENVPR